MTISSTDSMETNSDRPYAVRKGANLEKIIHAPPNANGWYRLTVSKDGDEFSYKKVSYK